MRTFLIFSFVAVSIFCKGQDFDQQKLLKHLQILSADSMEGRAFGTTGILKSKKYIKQQFELLQIKPAFKDGYEQQFVYHRAEKIVGYNLVGIIPGTTKKTIILTAHYDHLGKDENHIFNGADDNASGTAALFAIVEYFKENLPYHTLLIAALDGEEAGSIGAKYLLENFPMQLSDVVLNINLDMIGNNEKNELYACGTSHYPSLKNPILDIEKDIILKFGHDNPDDGTHEDWTYSSDHRVFHESSIPFIYFGVEDHEDYHQPTDTYENINKDFYINAVKFILNAIEAYDKTSL